MKKLKILIFDTILHFQFIYNPNKCDNPNNPPDCAFTPTLTTCVCHHILIVVPTTISIVNVIDELNFHLTPHTL